MSDHKNHPLFEKIREKNEFLLEELRVLILENIISLMESQGIDQAELAKRLGTSRAYITKLFNTSINLTLESLVKISKALGVKTSVHFHPPEARAVWFEVFDKQMEIKKELTKYSLKTFFTLGEETKPEEANNETRSLAS